MRVDLSNVPDSNVLESGDYQATFKSFEEFERSKSSGQPYIKLTFALEVDGRELSRNRSLQPQALWAFKKDLVALGVDPDVFSTPFDTTEVLQGRIGTPVMLTISTEDYVYDDPETGRRKTGTRNNIEDIFAFEDF